MMNTRHKHLHDETLTLPIQEHLQFHASQFKQKTQYSSHSLHKHTTLQCKKPLSSTILATQQTFPHSLQQKTSICHIHTSTVQASSHKIQQTTAHTYTPVPALKRYFPASLVTPLTNSDQINRPFSNHTYGTQSQRQITSITTMSLCNTHHLFNTAPPYAPLEVWTDPTGVTALLTR